MGGDTAKIEHAIELLEEAMARDADFGLADSLLAQASFDLYWQEPHWPVDLARAVKALDDAQRLAPDAGETHFAQAYRYYYDERDYNRTLGGLETAINLLPNNAEVFGFASRLDRRLNRWTDSIRHYLKAAELDPRESRYPYELHLTYRIMRRYREADEIADHAIAAFPEGSDTFWLGKSEAALDQGDTVRARKDMERVSSPNWYLLYRLSLCERNFAEAERARAGLAQDKEQSAVYPPSFWAVCIARFQGNREKALSSRPEARQAFQTLLHENSDHPGGHASLTLLDALIGSREDALREMHRARELVPLSRDSLTGMDFEVGLATVYAWIGERDKAIEQLAFLIKSPGSPSCGNLRLDPVWDPLREDPRFEKLIAEAARPLPF